MSSFLQRMGRTGRRQGQVANTTFFCETTDGVLQAIALIELARSGWVEPIAVNDRCWPVFIHQLLAMSLAGDGVALEPAWEHLSRVPDFRGIRREEFDRLVEWMIRDESFILAGRPARARAEGGAPIRPAELHGALRRLLEPAELHGADGRRQAARVAQPGIRRPARRRRELLPPRRARRGPCSRCGTTIVVSSSVRRLAAGNRPGAVSSRSSSARPSAGRSATCSRPRTNTLTSPPKPPPSSPNVVRPWADSLEPIAPAIEIADNEIRWWTFAGGRINSTLRYGLGTLLPGTQIVPDNFLVRLRGDDLNYARFQEALAALRDPSFWGDQEHVGRNLRLAPRLSTEQVPAAHAALGRARGNRELPPRRRWDGEVAQLRFNRSMKSSSTHSPSSPS